MDLKQFLTLTCSIAVKYSALELRLLNKDNKTLFRIKTPDDTLICGESKEYFPQLGKEVFAITNINLFYHIIMSSEMKDSGELSIILNEEGNAFEINAKNNLTNIKYRLSSKDALAPYPMINLTNYEIETGLVELTNLNDVVKNKLTLGKLIDDILIFKYSQNKLTACIGTTSSHYMEVILPFELTKHSLSTDDVLTKIKFNVSDIITVCEVANLIPNITSIKLKISERGLFVAEYESGEIYIDIKRRGAI